MENSKILFISGLHRSGTSILNQTIGSSADVSDFKNTGAPKDEGQHLQTVYQPAIKYGGVGRFARKHKARLNEHSKLINDANRQKLLQEWGKYWDFSKPVLLEKSPPNIIRTRFLQEMFPNAYFLTIIRNPIPVSYASSKWTKCSLATLIKHWIVAHKIYREDRQYLQREMAISYEEMVKNPMGIFKAIEDFVGISIPYNNQLVNKNDKYFKKWENGENSKRDKYNPFPPMPINTIIRRYEDDINSFGYSLVDLGAFPSLHQRAKIKPHESTLRVKQVNFGTAPISSGLSTIITKKMDSK